MAWLSNWRFRRKFTVDSGDVSANLSHFPVSLILDRTGGITGVDLTGIVEDLGGGNPQKIAVTESDGTTELYAEVEKWYEFPGGQIGNYAALWVSKAGWAIDSGADTVGYLYYDVAKPDNTANVGLCADGTAATEGVWDNNFKGVWHMVDATTSTVLDSTGNDNDGTKKAAGEPATTFANIGDCQHFDGVDDYITCGNDASLRITPNITLETLFNGDDIPAGIEGLAGIWDTGANKRSYALYWPIGRKPNWSRSGDGTFGVGQRSEVYHNAIQPVLTWHHYHGTFNAATRPGDIYKNAANVTTDNQDEVAAINQDDADFTIGCQLTNGATQRFFDGRIDEVRVSDMLRSTSYVTANYESQRDHFVTWGPEEKFSLRRMKQGVGL